MIFLSDNGPWALFNEEGGSAGPLQGSKGGTMEGGVRVPAIFWGQVLSGWALSLTSAARSTCCRRSARSSARGCRPIASSTGHDLSAVLRQAAHSRRQTMFFYRGSRLFAVRHGPFKAHFFTQSEYGNDPEKDHDPPRLYNLDHDPEEQFDIAATYPEVIARIRKIAADHARHRARREPADANGGAQVGAM